MSNISFGKLGETVIYLPVLSILFIQILINKTATGYTNSFNSMIFFLILAYVAPGIICRNFVQNRDSVFLCLWFLLSTVYLLFLAVVRGIPILSYWQMFRYDAQYFVIVLFYNHLCHSGEQFRRNLFKMVVALIAFESLVGLAQYFGVEPVYKITELQSYGTVLYDNYLTGILLPHGTLERYNIYGNVLSLMAVYCFCSYQDFADQLSGSYKVFVWLTLAAASYMVLLSGNRISLLSLGLSGAFYLTTQYKRWYLVLIPVLLVLVAMKFGLAQKIAASGTEVGFDNPLTRQLAIFTMFDGDLSPDGVSKSISTITLSLMLFAYIKTAPFFGAGLFFTHNGYDGAITQFTNNISDAYLMWILAEYGIVGLLIYLVPFIYMLAILLKRKASRSFFKMSALLICLLIQTITDQGLFHPVASMLIFTFFAAELLACRDSEGKEYLANSLAADCQADC